MEDNNKIEKKLVDRGWLEMKSILDKEMPVQKKRRYIFPIMLVGLLSLGVTYFTQSVDNSNTNHKAKPLNIETTSEPIIAQQRSTFIKHDNNLINEDDHQLAQAINEDLIDNNVIASNNGQQGSTPHIRYTNQYNDRKSPQNKLASEDLMKDQEMDLNSNLIKTSTENNRSLDQTAGLRSKENIANADNVGTNSSFSTEGNNTKEWSSQKSYVRDQLSIEHISNLRDPQLSFSSSPYDISQENMIPSMVESEIKPLITPRMPISIGGYGSHILGTSNLDRGYEGGLFIHKNHNAFNFIGHIGIGSATFTDAKIDEHRTIEVLPGSTDAVESTFGSGQVSEVRNSINVRKASWISLGLRVQAPLSSKLFLSAGPEINCVFDIENDETTLLGSNGEREASLNYLETSNKTNTYNIGSVIGMEYNLTHRFSAFASYRIGFNSILKSSLDELTDYSADSEQNPNPDTGIESDPTGPTGPSSPTGPAGASDSMNKVTETTVLSIPSTKLQYLQFGLRIRF